MEFNNGLVHTSELARIAGLPRRTIENLYDQGVLQAVVGSAEKRPLFAPAEQLIAKTLAPVLIFRSPAPFLVWLASVIRSELEDFPHPPKPGPHREFADTHRAYKDALASKPAFIEFAICEGDKGLPRFKVFASDKAADTAERAAAAWPGKPVVSLRIDLKTALNSGEPVKEP